MPPSDLTQLLVAWSHGDQNALDRLMPLIYSDVHRLAKSYLRRERSNHTLQPTALAHEAYMRLVDQKHVDWKNRVHFLGIAAQAMRRILVDHARQHRAEKRGGSEPLISLDAGLDVSVEQSVDIIALEDALTTLGQRSPRQSHIVELRFFGGLTIEETATALDLSAATVKLDWSMARAWLHSELRSDWAAFEQAR